MSPVALGNLRHGDDGSKILRLTNKHGAVRIRANAVTAVYHNMAGPALVTWIVVSGAVVVVNESMDDILAALGWQESEP